MVYYLYEFKGGVFMSISMVFFASLNCIVGFLLDYVVTTSKFMDYLEDVEDEEWFDVVKPRIKKLIASQAVFFYMLIFLGHLALLYYCNYRLNSIGLEWSSFLMSMFIYAFLSTVSCVYVFFLNKSYKVVPIIVLIIFAIVFPNIVIHCESEKAMEDIPYSVEYKTDEIKKFSPSVIGKFMETKYKGVDERYLMRDGSTYYYATEENGLKICDFNTMESGVSIVYEDNETPRVDIERYYRQYPADGEAIAKEEKMVYKVYLPESEKVAK